MRRFFALMCMVMLTAFAAHAQKVVSGTVTDGESGEALTGVTVFEKGTTNGTFTDENGKYSFTVSESGAVVVYRFVGYATVEQSGGGDVQLKVDALQLDDVVVTALGISREKKALGYAVQEVDGEELLQSRDQNVVNNLSGRVAGVNVINSSGNVGSSARITIRGNSSINGANQPLFVLNGVPISNNTNNATSGGDDNVDYGNVIADLNPEDIESMTVLKGPNAAALYGSRGANGVILITTKSGQNGPARKGVGVNYSMNVGFANPFRLPSYQNQFGQGIDHQFGYYDGANGGQYDGVDESWGPAFDPSITGADGIDNDVDGQIDEADEGVNIPQFTGTYYGPNNNGPIVGDGFDNDYDGTVDEADEDGYAATPWDPQPDNIRNFFQTGVTMTNNVSLSANNGTNYARFSYTNMNQTGMVPNTDYRRNSFDASFGGKLSERLSMDANVKYIRTDSDNRPGVGYDGDNVLQQSIWTGRQVDWQALEDRVDERDAFGNLFNWNHTFQNNPYFTLNTSLKPMFRDRIMGFYTAKYKITDWLTAQVRGGTDFYSEERRRQFAKETFDYPNGRFIDDDIEFQETNLDFLFMANKRFGDNFDISATFGGNRFDQTRRFTTTEVQALVVPGIFNVGNADGTPNTTDAFSRRRVNSLYGTVTAGYGGYLYLDMSIRNDWASSLPIDNNSYFYPAATASFLLSEAVDLPDMFDLVKVRGGAAQVGNGLIPAYSTQAVFGTIDPWNGTPAFIVPGQIPDPELRPERTNSIEAGLELRMLSNRLFVDFTYYNGVTNDLITSVTTAPSIGATSQLTNAGRIRNSGVELQVKGAIIQNADFQWTVGLNWARNQNTVLELADGIDAIQLGRYWSLTTVAAVGQPYGMFQGNSALYDDNENLILSNGLPQIDPESNAPDNPLGTITPDWVGGFNTSFSWKGFTLNALIDARWGSDLFSVTYMFGRYAGVTDETIEGRENVDQIQNGYVFPGVMYDGDSNLVANDVPVSAELYNLYYWQGFGGHDRNIFDASFVKLREISINYKLPASLFENNFVGGLEVGAYGRNLALLYSSVPHVDPESAFGAQLNVQGFEFGALPSARTYGFTLRANF